MRPAYYLPGETTPFQRWRLRFIEGRKPLPAAPRAVQIQTISGCNADCVFCPNQKTALSIRMGRRMDDGLYASLVDQCIELGVKRLSPYLMNEPTLDQGLAERVAQVTARRRGATPSTKINSHGGLLTERMARGLLDAGLDRLHVSVQGIDPEVYGRLMRLDFARTVQNVERMVLLRDAGRYRTRIDVLMLDTAEVHPQLDRVREFWESRGVDRVRVNCLENRGHHAGIAADSIAVRGLEPYTWCKRLFNQVYVLFDGRLVQCCADWEQTGIMGDASKESLRDIWLASTYTDYRRRFLSGDVAGLLCDGCTKDPGEGEDDDGD